MLQNLPKNQSTPLLLNKNILARSSIFKRIDPNHSEISEEKIKYSQIYQQLQRKIQSQKHKYNKHCVQLDQQIAYLQQKIKSEKNTIQDYKLNMWEMRNQMVELQEMFEQQANFFEEYQENKQQLEQPQMYSQVQVGQKNEGKQSLPHTLGDIVGNWDEGRNNQHS